MTRWIEIDEGTLSSTDIVAWFLKKHGYLFDPTNVGMAAKKLGLDYVQIDTGGLYKQKRYGEKDLPSIEEVLVEKMKDRQRYERIPGSEP